MMSALDTGVLRFKEDGKWKPVVVMGGFATVDSNQLSVLVNDFEKADGIDMKDATTMAAPPWCGKQKMAMVT